MLVYQRRRFKVYLFRIASWILISTFVYLFSVNKTDYAIVTVFLFLIGGVFPVTSLHVYPDSFVISRYLFYGFLPKTIEFDSGCQVRLTPVEIEFTQSYSAPSTLWDMLFSFAPSQKLESKKFQITKIDLYGNSEKVITELSEKELQLITNRIVDQQTR